MFAQANCTVRSPSTGLTMAGPDTAYQNNQTTPNCNSWALTWNTTGFSGITIQLEGSDDGSTWVAYSGATQVIVGTNPSSALSGTTKVVATTHLAFIRVDLTAATGTGVVKYQLYGSSGTTSGLGTGGSSGGGVASVGATTPLHSSGGTNPVISAVLADGSVYIGDGTNTPVARALSQDVNVSDTGVATVKGINSVPLCTGFTPTNGQNLQYTTGSSPNPCYTAATVAGGAAFSALSGGTNTTASMIVGSGASLGPTGTGTVNANQINAVPFCTGFTPTNSQFLQYTTGGSPNPCYTATTSGGGSQSGVLASLFTATTQGTTSTSFVDLATPDQVTFTCTATCNFVAQYSAVTANAAPVTVSCFNSVFVDGVQADDGAQSSSILGLIAGFAYNIQTVAGWKATAQASGSHTVDVRHKASSANTCNWNDRQLVVSIAP